MWLGVARPGRLRAAQFLFKGRLVLEEGSWSLVGRMMMPPNVVVRIAMLAVFGVLVCGVAIESMVVGGQLAVLDLIGLAVGVCMAVGAGLVQRRGVGGAQDDLT